MLALVRAVIPTEHQTWFTLALAGLGEILLVIRSQALPFVVAEVGIWVIVIGVALILAHPIVTDTREIDRRQIVVSCAIIGLIHALTQVIVAGLHTWSLLALFSEPAIGGIIGYTISRLALILRQQRS